MVFWPRLFWYVPRFGHSAVEYSKFVQDGLQSSSAHVGHFDIGRGEAGRTISSEFSLQLGVDIGVDKPFFEALKKCKNN